MNQQPFHWRLALMAIGFTLFCIYGSWVPLKFQSISVADAWQRFLDLPYLNIGPGHRADWVANLLLFVPLGFLWNSVFLADRHSKIRTLMLFVPIWFVLAMLSCIIEFSQAWFPNRTMSMNDIFAESIGAAVGAVLWLVVGQATVDSVRKSFFDVSSSRRIDTALEIYFVGLVLYQLLPLDLTLSLTELWGKLETGKIEVLPFAGLSLDPRFWYELLRDAIIYVPVGFLISVGRCPAGEIRSLRAVLLIGLFVLCAIEILQLFVLSRHSSSTDIIVGSLGIFLGYRIASIVGDRRTLRNPETTLGRVGSGLKLRLMLVFLCAFIPLIVFWLPFDFNMDRERIRSAYQSFWDVPFGKLYVGSEFNAISQVLAKVFVFMPLGIASGFFWEMPPFRFWVVVSLFASLLLAAIIGTTIELGQLFLPSKIADTTDILIYILGSLAGYQLIWRGFLRQRVVPASST